MNRCGAALLGLFIQIVISACGYFSDHQNLMVRLPQEPIPWSGRIDIREYRLSFLNREGGIEEQSVSIHGPVPETVEIQVSKGFCVPVTAKPLKGSLDLPPAGALYPRDSRGPESLVLQWEQGFACSLIIDLARSGLVLDSFNTERLVREIEKRSEGDPFRLDRLKILESVLSGNFRVTDIKQLPSQEIKLSVEAGLWFTESPFAPLIEAGHDGLLELNLTHGSHHLFNHDSNIRYDIFVDEREVSLLKIIE